MTPNTQHFQFSTQLQTLKIHFAFSAKALSTFSGKTGNESI